MGITPGPPPKPPFRFTDWGEPVPQRTLRELGLPAHYSQAPWYRRDWSKLINPPVLTDESFPWHYAIPGKDGRFSTQALWERCPAFKDNFETPVAMLWALLHPEKNSK